MQSNGRFIFEAAFLKDDIFVRCDILKRNECGSWDIIEVKSSTKIKDEHLPDVAIQKYVVERCDFEIGQVSLMLINSKDCYFPDLSNLFILFDVSGEIQDSYNEISGNLTIMKSTLEKTDEPINSIGDHCSNPTECPFKDYCWKDVPKQSIFTIPRLHKTKKKELIKAGILDIIHIPVDFKLSDKQQDYVDAVKNNEKQISIAEIRTHLDTLEYPLYFFDFETLNPAIPRFVGMKPYEDFAFQYSCHVMDNNGELEHREYLHTDESDPRLPITESLIKDLGDRGSIIVYNAPFERRILQKLRDTFSEYSIALDNIIERLWDQLDIFKSYYMDPAFYGSNSIKNVLPALAPELSYESLNVQKGDDAQAIWEKMIRETNMEKKQQLIEDLKTYCEMDTLAMVRIHLVLAGI
ncbi:MAG: DUF2779 domain-containing protein [Tissierellales bacterium]|nr:DUF2779 domain-containing protein [Tissierellales bacterium]